VTGPNLTKKLYSRWCTVRRLAA